VKYDHSCLIVFFNFVLKKSCFYWGEWDYWIKKFKRIQTRWFWTGHKNYCCCYFLSCYINYEAHLLTRSWRIEQSWKDCIRFFCVAPLIPHVIYVLHLMKIQQLLRIQSENCIYRYLNSHQHPLWRESILSFPL